MSSATGGSSQKKSSIYAKTLSLVVWLRVGASIDGSGSKNDRLESLSHFKTILQEMSSAQHMHRIEFNREMQNSKDHAGSAIQS